MYKRQGYDAVNDTDADDGYYVEAEPVKVTVGPVTLGYWFKTENDIMKGDESAIEHWYRHQLRASMPIYQGEKLNVGVQYGWEFANNLELADSSKTYAYKHDNGTHALWLNASYKVNENLTIDGYYEYDMYKWEVEGNKDGDQVDGLDSKDSSKYYGEFYIGWTYTF